VRACRRDRGSHHATVLAGSALAAWHMMAWCCFLSSVRATVCVLLPAPRRSPESCRRACALQGMAAQRQLAVLPGARALLLPAADHPAGCDAICAQQGAGWSQQRCWPAERK
jgi:hypothetical protein